MLEVCGSSLLWRLLPVVGVGQVTCQGFLVREACIGVLVGGASTIKMNHKLPAYRKPMPNTEI